VENKLDKRLTEVENRCSVLENDAKTSRNAQKKVASEVSKLKIIVDMLEQQKINKNVMLKGVPEIEIHNDMLLSMVDDIFSKVDSSFESQFLVSVRRIGTKNNTNKSRLIEAALVNCRRKLNTMTGLKEKRVDCSQFSSKKNVPWGSDTEKIYLSDHLTPTMSNIFCHARKLKKNKLINYT
jgi:hypothetical protein